LYKPYEGVIQGHSLGSGSYADNPAIEVYHMDHPIASGTNPRYGWMLEILQSFFMYDSEDRAKIISLKRELLKV